MGSLGFSRNLNLSFLLSVYVSGNPTGWWVLQLARPTSV